MSTNTCSLTILIWVTTEVGGIREKVGQERRLTAAVLSFFYT